jgi:two-component system, sensor histidine kinase and response regulator
MDKLNTEVTILIVDDNTENLKVVGNFFKDHNYRLAFASNGLDALEILCDTPVDLILLDVMMPEMDGFEVCKQIKNNPQIKDIPIIFLTAKTEIDDIVMGFNLGGVDYVTKPFRKEELLCRVKNHLELKFAREIIQKQTEELLQANKLIINTIGQFGRLYETKKPK